MARANFGGGAADFTFAVTAGNLLRLASATLYVWETETGDDRITDLQLGGSPVTTIPVGSDGQIPTFAGPDGLTELWVSAGPNGTRVILATPGQQGPAGEPGPPGPPGGAADEDVAIAVTTGPETQAALSATIAARSGVSITDYPRLTGETDDLARFQRAVDDLATLGGGRLVVPWTLGGYEFAFVPGSTILNPTRVLITGDNIEIVGLGQPTINMTGLTTTYLFSIDDNASSGRDIFTAFSFAGVDNGHVSGIRFVGEYTGNESFRYASPRSIAVGFKGCTNSSAKNVEGRNILGNLVNVTNSSGTYDAPFARSSNVRTENAYAVACLEGGINYMGGTDDCSVANITTTDCVNGVESACDGFTANGLILTGNRSSALALSGQNMVINGAICSGTTGMKDGAVDPTIGFGAVVTTGGANIQFNGGKFNDNNAYGIYLYPGVNGVEFNTPEIRGNAENATNKIAIYMVGTASRISDVSFNGGRIAAGGTVTGGSFSNCDNVHLRGMRGTFGAGSAFTFNNNCTGSVAAGNRFDKPITMSDPSGESSDNGYYLRNALATSQPNTGTWSLGDIIVNRSPSQGSIAEWKCIQSGTFGTLNGGATTGSITSGTTTLTVNSATGIYVGAWITITGVSGVKRITAVAGTTITIDSAASATVSDAAVAYRAAVIIPSRQNGPKTSVAASPDYVGQIAVTGGQAYIATSTSSVAGWKQVTT